MALFNAADALVDTTGLVTQCMGIEGKQFNAVQIMFGTTGLIDAATKGKFNFNNKWDLNDVYQTPPIQNIVRP